MLNLDRLCSGVLLPFVMTMVCLEPVQEVEGEEAKAGENKKWSVRTMMAKLTRITLSLSKR